MLPHTFAAGGRIGWDNPPFETLAAGDRAVAEALALARALPRLVGARGANPFGRAVTAAEALTAFGAGWRDRVRFVAWWADWIEPPSTRPRHTRVGEGQGTNPLPPPLLRATDAARAWMECSIADCPAPSHALLIATGLLARIGSARTVFVPIWSAYPAAGFGDRDALPRLRSDVATRLVGRGHPVTWPISFLHLVAESSRAASRELDRLVSVADKGRGLVSHVDRRSRLPDAIEALLRAPVLTPKVLAAQLSIAPQTGTALLRELAAAGLAREVTGRGSFRAFAI